MTPKALLMMLLKFGIATAIISWMIHKNMLDLSSLAVIADARIFVLMFSLPLIVVVLNNIRWTVLLKAKHLPHSQRRTLPLTFISLFFSFLIPGGVGGDVMKAYYVIKDHPEQRTLAASTILMDRIIGLSTMVGLAAVMVLFTLITTDTLGEITLFAWVVLGLFIGIVTFFVVSFSGYIKNHEWIQRMLRVLPHALYHLYEVIHDYRHNGRALVLAFLLSVLSVFIIVVFVYCFALLSNAPEVPFVVYIIFVPLGMLASIVPLTPSGIGVIQAMSYFLYKSITGIDSQVGPNAFTAYQVLLLLLGLVGAYFYATRNTWSKS
jgi:glycosyltransferase 2 family protein